MSIVVQDAFGSYDTGIWPGYVHTSGSYSVSGGIGTFTPGAGGLNSLGITSAPFQWDAGSTCQIKFRPSHASGLNFIIGMSDSAHSYDYNGVFGVYPDGGSPNTYYWDVNGSGSLLSSYNVQANTWTTLLFVARGDFLIDMYLDGVLKKTSANMGTGFDTTGATVQISFHIDQVNGSSGTLDIDDFVVDNNKTVRVEQSTTSGSGFSEVATPNLGVQSASLTGLLPATTYYNRMRTAVNGEYSDYTAESSFTTSSNLSFSNQTTSLLRRKRRPR